MESAASCLPRAKSVTVVMRSALPLELFGKAISERIAEIYKEKGVILEPNMTVGKLEGTNGQVTHALLTDGRKLPADIVILAVGSTYNTEFLEGSNVSVNTEGAVPTDEVCRKLLGLMILHVNCIYPMYICLKREIPKITSHYFTWYKIFLNNF